MNLKELLAQAKLKPHRSSPKEIHRLFSVVGRDLEDAKVHGLSSDRSFDVPPIN